MAWLIGIILVAMALFSIVGVMFMVMREKHDETEEWYIPPAPGTQPQPDDSE
ncbi:MAG: hypothetical protein ABI835_03430 [Chloroflexota bacterium]